MEVLFFMARMTTQAAFEATPRTARLKMVTDTHEMASAAPPADEAISPRADQDPDGAEARMKPLTVLQLFFPIF